MDKFKNYLWVKDSLEIPELESYKGIGLPLKDSLIAQTERFDSGELPLFNKDKITIESVIKLAGILDESYNELQDKISAEFGDTEEQAIFDEEIEERIGTALSDIIIPLLYCINPGEYLEAK
jgi:hypothetical protein